MGRLLDRGGVHWVGRGVLLNGEQAGIALRIRGTCSGSLTGCRSLILEHQTPAFPHGGARRFEAVVEDAAGLLVQPQDMLRVA